MVTVELKYSEHGFIHIDVNEPVTFEIILDQCVKKTGATLGGIIAVRDGEVVGPDDMVKDGDTITVFPALSGG